MTERVRIICGDSVEVAKTIDKNSIQCIITSPPYFQCRTYEEEKEEGDAQKKRERELGQEDTPDVYLKNLCDVFDAFIPCLKPDACVWVNIGDSISKKKHASVSVKKGEQMMIPSLFALEMRKRGWYIQQDVIWAKTNPIPSSTPKRCTPSHEYIFLFSRGKDYKFDANAIKVPAKTAEKFAGKAQPPIGGKKMAGGDNGSYSGNTPEGDGLARKRDVWFETTSRLKEAHFAPFPETIVEPCIAASTTQDDIVLDPFCGSGTTGIVAQRLGRQFVGIEIVEKYVEMSQKRIKN